MGAGDIKKNEPVTGNGLEIYVCAKICQWKWGNHTFDEIFIEI